MYVSRPWTAKDTTCRMLQYLGVKINLSVRGKSECLAMLCPPPPPPPPSNNLDGKVVKVGNRSIDPGGLVAVVHGAQQYLLRVLGEPDPVL